MKYTLSVQYKNLTARQIFKWLEIEGSQVYSVFNNQHQSVHALPLTNCTVACMYLETFSKRGEIEMLTVLNRKGMMAVGLIGIVIGIGFYEKYFAKLHIPTSFVRLIKILMLYASQLTFSLH